MSLPNLMGLLQQYVNPGSAATATTTQDFEQVSQTASPSHLAGGLAEAFRSNQTPPFAQMLTTLFSNSNGDQRAGILNHLLGASGVAGGSGMLGGLSSLLGSGTPVTPEQAQQVPPEAVREMAQQAEKNDPSIIDKASSFYAQHPTLVQGLGASALALIMSHMSRNG